MIKHVHALVVLVFPLLESCQGHLPPLETSPNYPGPTISDVVSHVDCELAQVVNSAHSYRMRISSSNKSMVIVGYVNDINNATLRPGLAIYEPHGLFPSGAVVTAASPVTVSVNDVASGHGSPTLVGLGAPASDDVLPGMRVSGTGIQADTYVLSNNLGTITLTKPVTTTQTHVTLTATGTTITLSAPAARPFDGAFDATVFDSTLDTRLSGRVNADPSLGPLLPYLSQYHFVATGQLTLEVTDTEGLNASLSYIVPYSTSTNRTWTLGFPVLNGTQDRSLNVSYSVDLAKLSRNDWRQTYCKPPHKPSIATSIAEGIGFSGGIAGDLGLADIIADGLTALNATATENVYGSSGPVLTTIQRSVDLSGGQISDLPGTAAPSWSGVSTSLSGTFLFVPPAAGALTPATVTLNGVVTLTYQAKPFRYVANLSGAVEQSAAGKYFSITGSLNPVSHDALADSSLKKLGFNPTVTLTGSLDSSYDVEALSGIITPGGGAFRTSPPPAQISFGAKPTIPTGGQKRYALSSTSSSGGSKASTASGSTAQGTSFGSLVDFIFSVGVNGGPNWTLTHLKGPAGSGGTGPAGGQLAGINRMNTDSLTITFVASCQNPDDVGRGPASYWEAIGPCDDLGTAQQQSAYFGVQNNYLMILNNVRLRP